MTDFDKYRLEVYFIMRSAIILAAGKGTRMKSELNKVMHPVLNNR